VAQLFSLGCMDILLKFAPVGGKDVGVENCGLHRRQPYSPIRDKVCMVIRTWVTRLLVAKTFVTRLPEHVASHPAGAFSKMQPNKSPEPTAVTPSGEFAASFWSSFVIGRRWLSFFR